MNDEPYYEYTVDPSSNHEITDGIFDILKAHYDSDIREVEKYSAANLSRMISMASYEICGNNFKKPSKKQIKKIRKNITNRIQVRYGKYFSLKGFNFINRRESFNFGTNLNYSYRHKKGILYGHAPESFLRPLFYTTHCLERFTERVDPTLYKKLSEAFKRRSGSDPSPADILDLFAKGAFSFGYDKDYRFLNVFFGTLVLEMHKDVLVCKTFLLPDMLKKGVNWREIEAVKIEGDLEDDPGSFHLNKITDLFAHKSVEESPDFYWDLSDEEADEVISDIAYVYDKNSKITYRR
jgi:hypothetical protein